MLHDTPTQHYRLQTEDGEQCSNHPKHEVEQRIETKSQSTKANLGLRRSAKSYRYFGGGLGIEHQVHRHLLPLILGYRASQHVYIMCFTASDLFTLC